MKRSKGLKQANILHYTLIAKKQKGRWIVVKNKTNIVY